MRVNAALRSVGGAVAACCLGAAASAACPDEIGFRFNPPDGISFTQVLKTTKVTDLGPLGSRTDVTTSTTRVTISKSATGYTLVATPVSAKMTRNGKAVDNPLLDVLQDVVVTYELDREGRIRAVLGLEGIADKMKKALPAEVAEMLSSLIDPKAMVEREKAEWNARIGSFVGMKAKAGDVWIGTDRFALPTGGEIVYYTATRIAERTERDGHNCVRILMAYDSDAAALEGFAGKVGAKIAEEAGMTEGKLTVSDMKLSGTADRLIDPDTMLIYSEVDERTISGSMDVPGQGKVATKTVEKREYRFDYPKS
jgi:hypothetical protein